MSAEVSAPPAISIRGLSKRYGSLTALNDLNLDVHRGETFGFLGLNGAGKTTAIRLLLDLLRPTSGKAFIFGYDCWTEGLVKRLRKKKRQAVAAELAYLESHRDRMDYAAARRNGEREGSGAMESTCRQYQCRFKRPGQFWSRVGDEPLMYLDTFWRNDRWHLLYPHIRHRDPCRN